MTATALRCGARRRLRRPRRHGQTFGRFSPTYSEAAAWRRSALKRWRNTTNTSVVCHRLPPSRAARWRTENAPGRPRAGRAGLPRHAQLASAPVRHAQDDGAGRRQARDRLRVCGAPIYSSCTQYPENVVSARRAAVEAGLSDVSVTYVGDWHDHPGSSRPTPGTCVPPWTGFRRRSDRPPASCSPRTASRLPWRGAARYRAQLMESSRLVADRLGIADWALVFQSRSGRPEDPWLEPDICQIPAGGTGPRPRRGGDLSDRASCAITSSAGRPGRRGRSRVPRRRLADGAGGHGE